MTEPYTLAELLDTARDGEEFGRVIQALFGVLERQEEQQ